MVAGAGLEVGAFGDFAAEHSGHRQSPDGAVDDLEDVQGGIANAEAVRGGCGAGASCRIAFSSRRTPHELIAEPNSTDTPRLSPVSRARSWRTFSRVGA